MVVTLVSLGVIGTGVVAYAYGTTKLPDENTDFKTNTTFVYYADGKDRARLLPGTEPHHHPVRPDPQHVKDAIVAAEKLSFWRTPASRARPVPGRARARRTSRPRQHRDGLAGRRSTQQ